MYRSKLEILVEVLNAVEMYGKKSKIIQAANLNWNSFLKYLNFCENMGYVERDGTVYRLTADGLRALRNSEEIIKRISEIESLVKDAKIDSHLIGYPLGVLTERKQLEQFKRQR